MASETEPPDEPSATDPRTLAEKIEHLFKTVRPRTGEYTHEEVANDIRDMGGPTISATYIWQLRKGMRDNPTRRHLQALAAFFGVPAAYFLDDSMDEQVEAELALLAAMRDSGVRTLATRAAALTPRGLDAIREMVERVLEIEGPPPPPQGPLPPREQ